MPKKKNLNQISVKNLLLFFGSLLVLLVAATSFFLLLQKNSSESLSEAGEESVVSPAVGNLFFTLKEPDAADDSDPKLLTYTFNTTNLSSEDTLEKKQFSELSQNGVDPQVSYVSFSPSKEWATFLATNKDLLEGEPVVGVDESYGVQVYRVNLNNSSLEESIARAEQLTNIQAAYKNSPSINDEGEVVFASRGLGTNTFELEMSPLPSDWVIHYIDSSGTLTELTNGLYPQWIDTGNLLFLSIEGVSHYVVGNDSANTLIEYDSELVERFGSILDVSSDGNTLLWSNLAEQAVEVMEINVNEGLVGLVSTFNFSGVSAYWPQLSPDGNYIGFLQYDPAVYKVYSLEPFGEAQEEIDMGVFDSESIYVTDWR